MSTFMTLLNQMHDEAHGAEEYAKCAMHFAASNKSLADDYASMAKAELDHFARLQRHAIALTDASDVELCKEVYDHCESKALLHVAEAKTLLDNYR